jgi:4-amino-4-deoxy-L-arabinose transferase-like glycosyltransferase
MFLWRTLQRLRLTTILVVAAVLRVASILYLRTYLHPETWEFSVIARNLNAGLGFVYPITGATSADLNGTLVPSALMPPAYPYLLAWLWRLFGDRPATYLGIELLNAALGVLLVYMVYRTARALLSESAAKLAAVICAVFPSQVYMCNEFHSISFYIVLGVAAVFFLNRYMDESHHWRDAVWAGLCMGPLLLFRAEAMAITLMYAACLVLRRGWKALGAAVAFAAISLAVLSPWVIRNEVVFHTFIPTMSTPGFNLWLGHNDLTVGDNHFNWLAAQKPALHRELQAVPLSVEYEVNVDKLYKRDALSYIRTHPRREVELAGRKLFLFFAFDANHAKGGNALYWVPSILLTCVGAFGVYYQRRRLLRQDLLLTATIAYAAAIGTVMFVLPRYRIVVDPFLMIFAAAVVDRSGAAVSGAEPQQRTAA